MARAPIIVFGLVAVSGLLGGGACGGAPGAAGAGGRGGAAGTGGGAGTGGMAGVGGAAGTGGMAGIGGAAGSGGVAGSGGAVGSGGTAGTGGAGGDAGTSGTGGGAGAIGGGGAGGAGGAIACTFAVTSSLSTAIPTVGIVTFTTDLAAMTGAEIRFGLASTGPTMTAPVDLTWPDHRTLLLGMRATSAYDFRIVATSAAGTCTSADYPLMTGALLANAPKATLTFSGAGRARGFILTSNTSGIGPVFIVDTDGAPVWSFPISGFATRAHMSWDGKQIYVVSAVSGAGDNGDVSRISMDGLDVEAKLSGLTGAHHDLTATPDGVAALMVDNTVVERSADGTLTTVAALATLYGRTGHPNSLHYYAWDDCYTIGDSGRRLYVKITRKGDLVWQFGGGEPTDSSKLFQGVPSWDISHGHQLLPDGTFAFFNNYYNGGLGGSAARVFKLDTTTMTATSVLTYQASGVMTTVLGDVQRLPNGNFLVNFSVGGQIREIDPSGQLVASYTLGANLGYAEFRESLYGPPPY